MPYDPNSNWSAASAQPRQAPVYFLAMEGVIFRLSTGAVKGASVDYKPFLKTPRGVSQEIFPLEGKSSIGSLSLDIVAEGAGAEVIALFSPGLTVPSWINRRVTLFGGYAGMDEGDFAPLFAGEVSDWDAKGPVFTLKVRDLKRTTLERVMENATEETPSFITGNPLNIWYALVTGNFSSGTFPVSVSGAAPTGLNVDAALIDEAHLARERDEWLFGWEMRFEFRRPERAKDFFEKDLYLLKGYPLVRGSGQLSARLYHPAHPAEPEILLDEDAVLGTPSLAPLFKEHLNVVEIWGDHNPDADENADPPVPEFALLYSFTDAADIAATKERRELIVKSRGLRTELDGERNARFAAGRIRQRFLQPPLELEVQTLFSKRALEVGDIVSLTHRAVPNLRTGERGLVKEQCEIVKALPDFQKGVMRLTLITTNFNRRYRVIAPTLSGGSPFPNYGAQTQAQRDRYLSIADTATEKFANGDEAQVVI